MQITSLVFVGLAATVVTAACGSSAPAPAASAPTNKEVGASSSSSSSDIKSSSAPVAVSDSHAKSAGGLVVEPTYKPEKDGFTNGLDLKPGDKMPMEVLIKKGTPASAFPKRLIGDRECWQGTALTGDHQKDYSTLIEKCGAATGLKEYAKPVTAQVHRDDDEHHTFALKLQGGMCYRYFTVADGSIREIHILVEKPNGALVADANTLQPVSIIDSNKTWCLESDAAYDFHVEVDGNNGGGRYIFAVWARPKG